MLCIEKIFKKSKKQPENITENQHEENNSQKRNHRKTDIKLYKRRWLILMVFTGQVILIRLLTNAIGIIDDIYKAYFNISSNTIDWFTLIQSPAMVISAVVLAVLIFNSVIGAKKLLILVSFCAVLSCSFSLISSAYPRLYGLIYAGQFAAGFGAQASSAISSSLASSWFAENEIGFAISFTTVGLSIGYSLSFFIPSQVFKSLPFQTTPNNFTQSDLAVWRDETLYNFLFFYGSLWFISTMLWFSVFAFVTDIPPKPPTLAQILIREQQVQGKWKDVIKNISSFCRQSKDVLFSKFGVQVAIILSIIFSCSNLQKLLLSDIVRNVFNYDNYNLDSDEMSGYVLVLFETGCFLGSVLSGKLIDHFKKHGLILFIYLFLSMLSMSGLALASHYANVPATFVFNSLLGISLCSCYVPIYDMVLEHTYPQSPAFVMLLFVGECYSATILFGEASMILLQYFTGTAVFAFMSVFVFFCLLLCLFVKPNYSRQKASKMEVDPENLRLLNEG